MSETERTRGRQRRWGVVLTATLLVAAGCSSDGGSAGGPVPTPGGVDAGTPSGTAVGDAAMLADIQPGNDGSFASPGAVVGDRLVFTAYGAGHGGLWVTDGEQVAPLADVSLYLDENADPDRTFTEMDGVQYFAGSADRGRAIGLWRTDATRAGTQLVAQVSSGRFAPDFGAPKQITAVGDTLYFVVDDGADAWELWRSDGTTAGTAMVSSQPRSDAFSAAAPSELVALGDTLLFSQEDPETGNELWRSDGTPEGTRLVADINPGEAGSRPLFVTAVGDRVFFAATDATHGNELWVSDGTEAGTRLVEDITPGRFDAYVPPDNPDDEEPPEPYSGIAVLGVLGDRLLFSADDGETGDEPWISDGTADGTHLVADLDPRTNDDGKDGSHPDRAYVWDGTAYFAADDGRHGVELWRTDGTADGTGLVADLVTEPEPYEDEDEPGGSYPFDFLVFEDLLHFYAGGNGTSGGIWRTDGTAEGTELVVDVADATGLAGQVRLGGSSSGLAAAGDALFFAAAEELHGSELWSTSEAALAAPRVRSVDRPTISGEPVVGGTLTATPGTFTPAKGLTYSYRWFVGFDVVPGEDGLTYRPRGADIGEAIGFRVIVTRPGLQSRVVRAIPTEPVRQP